MKKQQVKNDITFASMAEEMRSIRHRIKQLNWIEKRTVGEIAELEGLYKRLQALNREMKELEHAFDHEEFEYEHLLTPTNNFFKAFGAIAVFFGICGIIVGLIMDSVLNLFTVCFIVAILIYYFGYIRKSDR